MQRFTHALAFAVPFIFSVSVGPASGVDRLILGKRLDVKNTTGLEPQRRVRGLGKETTTDVPTLSNPTGGGATLTVIANGGTDSNQSYVLDASGWKASASGYVYHGPTAGDGDPVKRVILSRTSSGVATLKVTLAGNVGTQTLDVVPPNPGDDGGFILDVTGGDRYCVAFGAGSGGTEQIDTSIRWKLKNAQAQPGCPTGVAPPTTTTTTTTTATLPPTTTTTLPPLVFCPADPSRTINLGGPGDSACHQFDGDQANCEKSFHISGQCGTSSCWYDFQSGNCRGCGPNNRNQGVCVNTCSEGPPSCPGDSTRTIFAGFSQSAACHNLDFSQSLCEKAFHIAGDGLVASCYYDTNAGECRGCGPNNLDNGECQNTCPVCDGDASRTIFAGTQFTNGCSRFDSSQSSCEGAFVMGSYGAKDSCYYDSNAGSCLECDASAQASQECLNSCPVCQQDPSRQIFLGGPNTSPCHTFDNSPVLCEQAFHLSQTCGTLASCYYDFNSNQCNGCGPNNQLNGSCQNTCPVPVCGDGLTNQAGEQCDLDDVNNCSFNESCNSQCQCASPSGAFLDPLE